jgi:hypothetical protein
MMPHSISISDPRSSMPRPWTRPSITSYDMWQEVNERGHALNFPPVFYLDTRLSSATWWFSIVSTSHFQHNIQTFCDASKWLPNFPTSESYLVATHLVDQATCVTFGLTIGGLSRPWRSWHIVKHRQHKEYCTIRYISNSCRLCSWWSSSGIIPRPTMVPLY